MTLRSNSHLSSLPLLLFSPSSTIKVKRPSERIFAEKPNERIELRVCVNRSCSRQGSRSILEVLSAIAPPSVAVASCGCLGRCGAGPNLAVLPHESLVSHCGTPARAARVLGELLGPCFEPQRSLDALALRKKAEGAIEKGNFEEAEALLSQAIELEPSGGLHHIYRWRSAARLGKGDNEGALEDADEAIRFAPKNFQAYLCQGDVFMAMEEWAEAEKAYSNALLIDPSIRRSKSFKARVAKLQEKLVVSDSSS